MDCKECKYADRNGLCTWPDNHGDRPCKQTLTQHQSALYRLLRCVKQVVMEHGFKMTLEGAP